MAQIYTEDQELLIQTIKEFGRTEILPTVAERDRDSICDLETFGPAFEAGLHLLEIPESFGGMGLDFQSGAMAFEELGYWDAGYAITLVTTFVALRNVIMAGTPEQAKAFAEKILPGGLGAFCLTEPSAGSDAGSLSTRAVRDGDEYVINGSKCWITNGALASAYVVLAKTDPEKGNKGISCFIVEADREGISHGQHEDKMGLRTSNTCDVVFRDVRVPAANLVGEEGQGFKIALSGLDVSRAFMATISVGMMQRALDESVRYAKERKQFGQPIINFQMIQELLASMACRVEACRTLVQNTMRMIDEGIPMEKEGSITKKFVTDQLQFVVSDAVQVHGGNGYSRQYPVEKIMRDAKIFQIMEGTNQVQSMVIAKCLNKEYN